MTHRVTRHPGAHGSTLYECRAGLHRVIIRSPMSWGHGNWRRWSATVYLYGFAMSRGPEEHCAHGDSPRAAAEALLRDLPPQHRDEIAPALAAILDALALEPLP
jgi:hypothetical protein